MNANINTNTAAADLFADEALLASMLDDFIEPEVEVAEDKQELDIDLTNESAAPSSDAEILDDLFGDEPLANADDLAADLAAVTASIEKAESVKAIYEEQGEDDAFEHLFGGQPEADKPTDPAAAPAKKPKKAAAKKEDPTTVEEPQTASEEQPAQEPQSQVKEAAPKEPKAPRLTYVTNKKSEVLAQKLGSKASEYLLLEVADAALDEDGLKAKMDEVLEWQKEASAYERDISKADLYIKRKLLGAGCMAVALYTYRYQPERAREFWSGVAANDGLRKNDARARLIADMMERRLNSGLSRQTVFQPMLAWNAWNEGRELKIIKIAENTRLNLWGTPLEVK